MGGAKLIAFSEKTRSLSGLFDGVDPCPLRKTFVNGEIWFHFLFTEIGLHNDIIPLLLSQNVPWSAATLVLGGDETSSVLSGMGSLVHAWLMSVGNPLTVVIVDDGDGLCDATSLSELFCGLRLLWRTTGDRVVTYRKESSSMFDWTRE